MRDELRERQQQFLDEVRDRQRNIVWPDATRNARSVNALLWHGTARPTMVQRIGMFLLGMMFAVMGLGFLTAAGTLPFASNEESPGLVVIVMVGMGAPATVFSFRMFRNALRRSYPPTNSKNA